VTSRQATLPMANDARIKKAEKKQPSAHRIFWSLDNRGPHKGSAPHGARGLGETVPDTFSLLLLSPPKAGNESGYQEYVNDVNPELRAERPKVVYGRSVVLVWRRFRRL